MKKFELMLMFYFERRLEILSKNVYDKIILRQKDINYIDKKSLILYKKYIKLKGFEFRLKRRYLNMALDIM